MWASSSSAQPVAPRAGAADLIGLEEVERGQRGYGLSVFAGASPERFDVEVIGVLREFRPGMSFILARFSGQGLEESGVVAGMSGSPVYLDERLAGAVAFSWDFSTGAIGGITPIAEMRALSGLSRDAPSARPASRLGSFSSLRRLLEPQLPRELLDEQVELLRGAVALEGSSSTLQYAASGYTGAPRELLTRALGAVAPVGRASDALDLPPLQPGSAVTAVLVGGDLSLTATGTVTEVAGDELVAFGHPIYGLGPVRVPMAKVEVLTVVPSRLSSFKLSNVGEVIGAFDQDRMAGVRGLIGAEAPTASLVISLDRAPGPDEASPVRLAEYALRIADLPLLRPTLAAIAVLQALDAASHSSGDQSLEMTGRFAVDGFAPLDVRQIFDGPNAGMDAAIYMLLLVGFFELSDWQDVELREIEVSLLQHPRVRRATLTSAHADRRQVRAGETVQVRCELRGHDGSTSSRTLEVGIPHDAPPGPYYLFVGDATTIDSVRQQIEPTEPSSFEQALEVLRGLHPRDRLAVLGARAARGLVVSGRAMPDLPGSMRSIWGAASPSQVRALSLSIQQHLVEDAGLPLEGAERIDLEVIDPVTGGAAGD
ncbi:MAG TPA: hypothetical protein VMV46_20215 [Thermoanaerobaculia bacterium]|nr:hypothetical protein [Thermoanaerobaculia bacterium]